MFRKVVLFAVMVMVLMAATFSPVSAKSKDATVYVVHGIPGTDLGLDPALPVDISVNGACALQGFVFGQIAGPLSLAAGTYNIQISLANTEAPCSNAAVIAADVPFAAGENASVVAYLTPELAPTAGKFVNDLKASRFGFTRVIAHHTAAAPEVDIKIFRGKNSKMLSDVANGMQGAVDLMPGRWSGTIAPAGSPDPVFGPVSMNLKPFTAYLVYAVGSLQNGTFTLLTKEIKVRGK